MKEKENMIKKSKTKTKHNFLELQNSFLNMFKNDESKDIAHHFLRKLAEKIKAFKFGVSYSRDDNPTLRAGFFSIDDNCKVSTNNFQPFTLASIRKNGKLIAGERNIALWHLSEYYEDSPIEFKCETMMTLEDYAFWMRTNLRDVENIFCQEILINLMKYTKHDPMWRLFSIVDGWINIDPWQFMIEFDLSR